MASRLNPQDEDEFEILLSREDYQELKAYEGKLKDMEGRMKIREGELGKLEQEIKLLRQELTLMRKQKQLISSQCWILREKVQKEYTKFSSMIDKLLKACSIAPIPKPSQNLSSKGKISSNLITNDFSIIETTLEQMTKLLFSMASPIQSLLNGNKLIHESLITQHQKTSQELKQLHAQLSKFQLQKSSIEEQCRLRVNELGNELQCEKANAIQLQKQVSQLRRQNTQLIGKLTRSQTQRLTIEKDNDLLLEQNTQLHQEVKQLQEDNVECQQHIQILKSKHQRHNQLNNKKSNRNQNLHNKFQKQSFIKQTVVEYAREIRNNLISIGTLSQDEIKEIGVSELNMLVEFIHELEEDFE